MSEIRHPKLDVKVEFESLELVFAHEAFEAIASFGVAEVHDITKEHRATFLVTDRADIDTETGECALRLRVVPTLEVPDKTAPIFDENGEAYDNRFIVIVLEYCDSPEQYSADIDLPWKDYVAVAIEMSDANRPILLDAATGKELEQKDAFKALQILRELKNGLREMCYEDDCEEVGVGFSVDLIVKDKDFDPGDFIKGNACSVCQSEFTYCDHAENVGSIQ